MISLCHRSGEQICVVAVTSHFVSTTRNSSNLERIPLPAVEAAHHSLLLPSSLQNQPLLKSSRDFKSNKSQPLTRKSLRRSALNRSNIWKGSVLASCPMSSSLPLLNRQELKPLPVLLMVVTFRMEVRTLQQ